ncbi:hypothetical protein [Marinicella pacifica]
MRISSLNQVGLVSGIEQEFHSAKSPDYAFSGRKKAPTSRGFKSD